jgi:hypothetical protein
MHHPSSGIAPHPTGLGHGDGQHRHWMIPSIPENKDNGFVTTNMYTRIAINQPSLDSPNIFSTRNSGRNTYLRFFICS